MTKKCIALLGRRDAPTDAIEEYCQYLGEALRAHDFELETSARGVARRRLARGGCASSSAKRARGAGAGRCWVQYTALSWSERGFPLRFLRVLRILRQAGARVGMVYHDVLPYHGNRTIDKLRRRAQNHAMSEALRSCDLGVFTVPVSKIPWVGKKHTRATFIPVGANLPAPETAWGVPRAEADMPADDCGIWGYWRRKRHLGDRKHLRGVAHRNGAFRKAEAGRNGAPFGYPRMKALQREI